MRGHRDGSRIAFSATINPDLIQGVTSDIYLLNLADDCSDQDWFRSLALTAIRVGLPTAKQIVFSSAMGDTTFFASNSRLAVVSADGGAPRSITDDFDENPGLVDWRADGIYFTGQQKTASHLVPR